MKNVWILERWITREEMEQSIREMEKMLADCEANRPEAVDTAKELLAYNRKDLENNPDGRWLGYQGKSIYRQFCECAKETMRYFCGKNRNEKFRVVKAEIPDDAKYWTGYKNPVENDRVMAYLWATYKH